MWKITIFLAATMFTGCGQGENPQETRTKQVFTQNGVEILFVCETLPYNVWPIAYPAHGYNCVSDTF